KNFQVTHILDGCIDFFQWFANAEQSFLHHAGHGRIIAAAEPFGTFDIARLHGRPYIVHKVFVDLSRFFNGKPALQKNSCANYGQYQQDSNDGDTQRAARSDQVEEALASLFRLYFSLKKKKGCE